jgi:glucan biosynthesis protein
MEPIRDWHQIAGKMLMTDANLALQYITSLSAEEDAEAAALVVQSTRTTDGQIREKRRNLTLSASEARSTGFCFVKS